MKNVRIGMIGYGGIGKVHGLGYRNIPFHYGLNAESVSVAAVATTKTETAKRAAAQLGCDVYTDDFRRLLERDDIDAVDICAPNNKHAEIIVEAAKHGKHIYCEKPLSLSVEESRAIVEAVETAGVINQMTFNFRFFPAIIRAQQLIAEGFLGRIFSFRGRYFRSSYINPEKPYSWRLDKEVSGGGALFDLGSHILDLLYALLGPFTTVSAILDTLIKERPKVKGSDEMVPIEVDDIALLNARLADGTLGTVETSRMGTGTPNDLQLEIFGESGAIRFNSSDPSWLEVYDLRDSDQPLGGMRGFRKIETIQRFEGQAVPDWSMPPSFLRTHTECQYQFVRAVAEGRSASPSFRDGFHVQSIMSAAAESSRTGSWQPVESL